MNYCIRRTAAPPPLDGDWDNPAWRQANTLEVANFYSRPGSSTHPQVQAKLLHDGDAVYVFFQVHDQYVICRGTQYHDPVCRDSCVEFFVEPKPDKGYLNFEVNCGGTLLVSYVEVPVRTPDGFEKYTPLPWDIAQNVQIEHSMPAKVDPEIAEPVDWWVAYRVPLGVLSEYVGELGPLSGQQWRANFYKCADDSSHPHWASWAPIEGRLDFHQPEFFAPIHFE